MVNPKKKPKFLAQGAKYLKRIKNRWRRPRGRQSKLRRSEKSKGKKPSLGYGAPKKLRGLHPSGFKEVLVRTIKELDKIDQKNEAVRISGSVGKKKKEEIVKKARELKLKILNP